ncbi:uncharacterized protein LOC126883668 [Diabrotica virgifera virgifera]|uniref:Uncharacterized protein n=1 Tax=Diabrotica virgifera virgifera TaxID=50390 RepID=A0ABM5K515_DIAVI|nr:uncharacterized protein LOC126883668 [Diabrotica virgifera virgifera]
MTDGNTSANTSASVDRISVKIPPFWPKDPEIWFLQVENQFTLTLGTYKLKSELIKRLSASQQQKIKRLLEHEELGDQRPSQFLRHLQSLAGTTVPDNIVRSLWLGKLPSSTQAILATQAKASLEAVAELAGTISEAIAPRAQISEASNALESTIDKLTADLADMKIQHAAGSSTNKHIPSQPQQLKTQTIS